MSTVSILFALPLLVIFSYLFDAFARKTKFPAVILLLLTGVLIRVITSANGYEDFEFLNDLIPVLGTIGLILIVLEGALELEINRQKLPTILKGFLSAIVILLLNIVIISWLFNYFLGMELHTATIFATPLSIISSAVAIPSAANLLNQDKEFVVYESTFSDILGIVIFNYAIRQAESGQPMIAIESIVGLGLQILGIVVISTLITYVLFRLLQNIEHHVKFFLILSLLILVYAIGKFFHLPALLTIFIFGVFLSNIKELLPKFLLRYFQLNQSEKGLHEFHILTAESTFIVRTFFFLFFGFSIVISDFDSFMPLVYGVLVFAIMFLIRYLYFVLTSFKIKPSVLLYMSPRGLISILLFLQIKDLEIIQLEKSVIDERMLLIVILTSMLVMTLGTLSNKQKSIPEEVVLEEEEMIGLNSSEDLIEEDSVD
ncbi:cation:proton antiporter [Flavobacteriaceae bacterium]|nr:cation:proton antiporter [Flavobacteriaceae bacterium]MDA8850702.1 cation:proton antiporter [Flavobacteriaceae bacterium]MDA9036045.1 cation:proton antiporter [Flavobacteriaceae bacterium]MDA9139723.1 cation:proton antiporter [Flavobacteriaceae bacterium]